MPEEERYYVKVRFRRVLQQVPGVPRDRVLFTWNEVCEYLGRYIRPRLASFGMTMNSIVGYIGADPLGEALGVEVFHQDDIRDLLTQQLVNVRLIVEQLEGNATVRYRRVEE